MLWTVCTKKSFFHIQAFANYLAYKRDNNELLLFILRQLANDHLTFNRNRYGGDFELVEVPEEEFIEKVRAYMYIHLCVCVAAVDLFLIQARQINIHSMAPFYESELFKKNKFIYDRSRKQIVQQL